MADYVELVPDEELERLTKNGGRQASRPAWSRRCESCALRTVRYLLSA
jgi:hypothetical protein